MTYVVTENCIKCQVMDWVEVCPVDCFYVGQNMLVINPDECIDCGVRVPECPTDAIFADSDPEVTTNWLELNRIHALRWPNMTHKDRPQPDDDAWNGVEGKKVDFRPAPHKQTSQVSS
jgi:ferredoxin